MEAERRLIRWRRRRVAGPNIPRRNIIVADSSLSVVSDRYRVDSWCVYAVLQRRSAILNAPPELARRFQRLLVRNVAGYHHPLAEHSGRYGI